MRELPEGWDEAELGDVSNVQWGNTSLTKKAYTEKGFTAFSAAGPDGYLAHFEHEGPGVVLSAIGARCGKCFKADGSWTAIKNTITVTEIKAERDYLFGFLNDRDRWPQKGGAQPFITLGAARKVELPLPPLAEQKRIVAKLDALGEKSARARKDLARINTLVTRYKQAVLSKAFSGELTKDWRAANGLERPGLKPISCLCRSITDGDHQAPPKASSGIPFITISAMNDGIIDLSKATRFVPQGYYDNLQETRRPKIGDVLYSVTGSYGIPAVVNFEVPFVFQRHIAILRPNEEEVLTSYLAAMLQSPQVKEDADRIATGTAQKTVPLKGLRQLQIPALSLAEQIESVRRIESAFQKVDRLAAEAKRALKLVGKLDEAILAKAFRGELVPQDPNDEPASVLLDRIKAERAAAPKPKRGRGRKG